MTPGNLKKLRLRANLSPQQSANIVHISKRSWERYEAGDRDVPEGIVHLFCLMTQMEYPPKFSIKNISIRINVGKRELSDIVAAGNKRAADENAK